MTTGKKAIPIFLFIFTIAALVLILVYFKNISIQKTTPVKLDESRSSNHTKQLQAIDDSWDNIESGNRYFKSGQYEQATNAYNRAYNIGGEKVLAGFKLVNTYEKMGKYDEALAQLGEMIQNLRLNKASLEDALTMKSRLLAAKSQAAQGTQSS